MRELDNPIFSEAAYYARIYDPYGMNLLIAPVEGLPEIGKELAVLPQLPVLYVTRTGYIPYATKSEIIRRRAANLFVLGGEEHVSEWVVYVLSTLTRGRVFRILAYRTLNESQLWR